MRIEDVHPKILEVCILYGELDVRPAIDDIVLDLISNVRFFLRERQYHILMTLLFSVFARMRACVWDRPVCVDIHSLGICEYSLVLIQRFEFTFR